MKPAPAAAGLVLLAACSGPSETLAVGADPTAVAIADLNGDGTNDLVVANGGDGTVGVLLGLGKGKFAAQVTAPAQRRPFALAIADLDGDGHPDVVALNQNPTGAGEISACDGGLCCAVTANACGSDCSGCNASLSIFLNRGDGTLGAPATVVIPGTVENDTLGSIAVADVDGDGTPDVVITADPSFALLLGDGGGRLAAPTFPALAVAPRAGDASPALAVGDVDGDGRPDIVTLRGGGPTVYLRRDGGFAPPVGSGGFSLNPAAGLALGDFHGNGSLALAGSDGVAIAVGTPTSAGLFTPTASDAYGAVVVGPAANFDDDPHLDLLASDGTSLGVLLDPAGDVLVRRIGLGGASLPRTLQALAAGDLNGDGQPDIAAVTLAGGVALFFNGGRGSF